MFKMTFVFPVLWSLILLFGVEESSAVDYDRCDLKLVFLVWRHGERAPTINMPWIDFNFTETSLGHLTNEGKERMYNLGRWLRSRYDKFLGGDLGPPGPLEDVVRLRSTDIPRAIMSGMLVVAGMFPPPPELRWNDNLGKIWQPLPFKTVPESKDYLLLPWKTDCPLIKEESALLKQRYKENHHHLFAEVGKATGLPDLDMDNMTFIGDTMIMLNKQGKEVPSWAQEFFPDQFLDNINTWFVYTSDGEGKYSFAFGPLFHEIYSACKNWTEGLLPPSRKLYAYSAHVEVIMGIFTFVGLNFDIPDPTLFGTVIMFELRECEAGKPGIVMLYREGTKDPVEVPLACPSGSPCPLDEFQKRFGDRMLSEHLFRKACQVGATSQNQLNFGLLIGTLFFVYYVILKIIPCI